MDNLEQITLQSRAKICCEHVLVVDDEELMREYVVQLVTTFGYRVSAAASGEQGLEIIREQGDVDLLLTDIVMPGMSGPDLADAAKQIRPELCILFTSGRNREAIVGELPDQKIAFLQKPYRRKVLADRLRALLDSRPDL